MQKVNGRTTAAVNNSTYDVAVADVKAADSTTCSSIPEQESAKRDDGSHYVTPTMGLMMFPASPSNNGSCPGPAPALPLSNSDTAYKELRRRSFALVNKDREVFVSTRSYQRACDLLKRRRIVIIRGGPRSGKSATGLALLRHFAINGFAPLILQNCQEWRNHVKRNKKQSVLLDCVFGEVKVEKTRCVEWTVLFRRLTTVMTENPNCLLVITFHPHIMAQLDSMVQAYTFFDDIPLVDMDDIPFTPREKEEILKKHLAHNNLKLDSQIIHKIISQDLSGPAFPSCCDNYATDFSQNQYINLGYNHEVFITPGLTYVQFFCAVLQDSENWKDLVPLLILAVNKSGFVLGQDEQMEMKLRMLGFITIDIDMEKMQTLAVWLKGSILSADMKEFKNRDLSDGFSFALFKNHSLELFLNACSAEFLVKHVHVEPTFHKTDIIIDNTSPFFPKLMQRICQEILSGNLVQMSQHPAFQSDRFLGEFEAYLLEKRCLKTVIAVRDHHHNMPLLYWSAWSYSRALTCWCLKQIPSTYDGRVVRRTFFVCSLFGEKLNSPRMTKMFGWLCENEEIMNDAVSAVSLPVPAPEDRLCEEVRTKSHKVLSGPTLLTCGLSENTIPLQTVETRNNMFIPQRMDDSNYPGSPKAVAEASDIKTFLLRLPDIPSTDDGSIGQSIDVKQDHQTNCLTISTITQGSDVSSGHSDVSSSSSGSYISLQDASPLVKQAELRQTSGLPIISENDADEGAGEFPSITDYMSASGKKANTPSLDRGRHLDWETRTGSFYTVISERTSTLPSVPEGHLQSGKPLPPSIVKISAEKDESKVILQPICGRWYTFLRLVSMCDVDEVNSRGYTLLHTAAFNGEINIVQFLVESGADLVSLTQLGNTALTKAVERNQVRVASYLLKQGSKLLRTSTRSASATEQSCQDLSWMFGTRKLYDVFSRIVQKRRAQMLCLLFSFGIQLQHTAEMDNLLEEASSVDDNSAILYFLNEQRNRTQMVTNEENEDAEDHYSVPEPPVPLTGATRPDADSKQKHTKRFKFFFRK